MVQKECKSQKNRNQELKRSLGVGREQRKGGGNIRGLRDKGKGK